MSPQHFFHSPPEQYLLPYFCYTGRELSRPNSGEHARP
jgi:hypothetical protein